MLSSGKLVQGDAAGPMESSSSGNANRKGKEKENKTRKKQGKWKPASERGRAMNETLDRAEREKKAVSRLHFS